MRFLYLLVSILYMSCSGISILHKDFEYDEKFLKRISGIQSIYKDGDRSQAIIQLNKMRSEDLSRAEEGKVLNFLGLIYYSQTDYIKAQESFEEAKKYIDEDQRLKAELHLNLASTYLKLEMTESAFNTLKDGKPKYLDDKTKVTYYKLKILLAKEREDVMTVIDSAINLMAKSKSFNEINNSEYREVLVDYFKKLTSSERAYFLEKKDYENSIVLAYLGTEEIMFRYYFGDRQGAQDALSWLDNKFGKLDDVSSFIDDFKFKIKNFSKIDSQGIGVVIPLSGNKEKFGLKVLQGLDSALNSNKESLKSIKVYTRDNQDNPLVARKVIHDLVRKHHVSLIIGGLYDSTAIDEYLEAKKYGILFISLSPINLPRHEKDHLLIEIPGSIQSQVDALMSEDFINKFGNRVALFYPENRKGHTYLDEFWKKSEANLVELTSVASFEESTNDPRDWVKSLLGLKFPRERKEELELWKEIHSLEKSTSSIRRIQDLKPIIDFDWVFIPSYPHQAIQIIPSFSYFDAKSLTFIGEPSWISQKLIREQRGWGKLLLTGDDPTQINKEFYSSFYQRNKTRPGMVDSWSFEAMSLALDLIVNSKFESRDDLEKKLVSKQKVKGLSGIWNLKEGLWIKDLDILKLTRSKVVKLDLSLEEEKRD